MGPLVAEPIEDDIDKKIRTDAWSGERWDLVGNVFRTAVPIVAVLAILVGVFAAQNFNEGAECVSRKHYVLPVPCAI